MSATNAKALAKSMTNRTMANNCETAASKHGCGIFRRIAWETDEHGQSKRKAKTMDTQGKMPMQFECEGFIFTLSRDDSYEMSYKDHTPQGGYAISLNRKDYDKDYKGRYLLPGMSSWEVIVENGSSMEDVAKSMAIHRAKQPTIEWTEREPRRTASIVGKASIPGNDATGWEYQINQKNYVYFLYFADDKGNVDNVQNECGGNWFGTMQEAKDAAFVDLQGKCPK